MIADIIKNNIYSSYYFFAHTHTYTFDLKIWFPLRWCIIITKNKNLKYFGIFYVNLKYYI